MTLCTKQIKVVIISFGLICEIATIKSFLDEQTINNYSIRLPKDKRKWNLGFWLTMYYCANN